MPRPAETVPIVLKYEGPEVDDGSMSIEDIVPVLEGFASAYGKIAADQGAGVHHRVRITGVTRGSANILLEIWDTLNKASGALTSIQVIGSTAIGIVVTILGVIRLRRHVKNKPFRDAITANNTISVTNSENVTIEMPVQIYGIFKSKLIDADIAKIARPLDPGRIDSAEVSARQLDGQEVRERIEAGEREFFEAETVTVTSTKETWLVGKLNSLTKTTESGFLNLTDGSRVFYEYVGDVPKRLHEIFGTYDGPVRVRAVAHMDENLKVQKLQISEIEIMQGDLFPREESGPMSSPSSS